MAKKTVKKPTSDLKLTKNFSQNEFTFSRQAESNGIANNPSSEQVEVIRWVAENVAQPIRDLVGAPVRITSGFRSKRVNDAVGGVADSYHSYDDGKWAFDFVVPTMTLFDVMNTLKKSKIPFTKVILELDQGVIHVQGLVVEFLVREVVSGRKVYTFLDQYEVKRNA